MGAAITAVLSGTGLPQTVILTVGDGYGAVTDGVLTGDSNAAKGYDDDTSISQHLTRMLGVPIIYNGVGGDISAVSAGRLNVTGLRPVVTAAFVVPITAPAPITFDFVSPNKPLKNNTVPIYHGYFLLSGSVKVAGTITKVDFTLPNNPFVFSVDVAPTVATTIPSGTEWYTDSGDVYRPAGLHIFMAGGNDINSKPESLTYPEAVAQVVNNWLAVKAYMPGRTLVIGPPNGAGSEPGTAVFDQGLLPLVQAGKDALGQDFYDVRPDVVLRGIEIAEAAGVLPARTVPEIAADDAAQANDTVPPSLRAVDALGAHYNAPGRYVVAALTADLLLAQTIPSPLPAGSTVIVTRSDAESEPVQLRGGQLQTPPGGLLVIQDAEAPVGRELIYTADVFSAAVPPLAELVTQVNTTPNPSFEVVVTGWVATAGTTLTRTAGTGMPTNTGSWFGRTTANGAGLLISQVGAALFSEPMAAGDSVTGIAWVKGPAGAATGGVAVQFFNAAGATVGFVSFGTLINCATGAWTKLTHTFTVPATATKARMRVMFFRDLDRNPTLAGHVWDIAAAALIVRSILGDYFDGTTPGAAWSGTAHASSSSLQGTKLTGGQDGGQFQAQTRIVVPDPGRHVLTDPLTGVSVLVDVVNSDDDRSGDLRHSEIQVDGREHPIIDADVREGERFTKLVYTRTRAETRALKALLRSPFLVSRHPNDGCDEVPSEVVAVTAAPKRRRWAERDAREGDRLWTLDCVVIDSPDPEAAPPLFTWADVILAYTGRTWADLQADFPTWLNLLTEFRPVGAVIIEPPDPGTPPVPVPVMPARPAYVAYAAFGMNTHTGFTGATDTNSFWQETVDYLIDLGAGLVRQKIYTSGTSRTNTRAALQQLMAAGVRVCMPTLVLDECSSLAAAQAAFAADIAELLNNPAVYNLALIDSFPGINEPNGQATGSGAAIEYANWAQRTKWAQQAIYEGVKGTPQLAAIPVQGPPLQKPVGARLVAAGQPWNVVLAADTAAVGNLSAWCDRADAHSYTADQDTAAGRAESIDSARIIAPGKPLVISEQGYSNSIGSDLHGAEIYNGGAPSVPSAIAAKYAMKQPLNAVYDGYLGAWAYELLDNQTHTDTGASTREGHFGYVATPILSPASWVVKPAFTNVKRLLALVKDPGATFTAAGLAVSVTGGGPNLRHLLLQRRTGEWLLCLWRTDQLFECNVATNTGAVLTPAAQDVEIKLAVPRTIAEFRPDISSTAISTVSAALKTVPIADGLHILRIT